jgi:protein TonB
LVVYEKGKVVFRMKSAPTAAADSASANVKDSGAEFDASTADAASNGDASSQANGGGQKSDSAKATTKIGSTIGSGASVWISSDKADALLLSRTEPHYPAKARAARRSGNVVLEVLVGEDGSVSKIRTLSGDPVLAAAATEAVRNWRYQPYRQNDHPAQFQTDVTLNFALPN